MPQRNFIVIVLTALASVICYTYADRTRYAAVFAHALNEIQANYDEDVDQRTDGGRGQHVVDDRADDPGVARLTIAGDERVEAVLLP